MAAQNDLAGLLDDARCRWQEQLKALGLAPDPSAGLKVRAVTFVDAKLGLTLRRGALTGKCEVAAIEADGAAEAKGVVVGDVVVAIAGGAGSGFPTTTIAVEGYDQLMRLYRKVSWAEWFASRKFIVNATVSPPPFFGRLAGRWSLPSSRGPRPSLGSRASSPRPFRGTA